MITFEMTNLVPTIAEGHLTGLEFDLKISDGVDSVQLHWNQELDNPVELDDESPEHIKTLAEAHCETMIYPHMKARLRFHKESVPNTTPQQPAAPVVDNRASWVTQIDNTIAGIYNQFTRFQMEYEAREKAALEYKNSGYKGEPTIWIKRFADNTGISYKQCTDTIISQSIKLRSAIMELGQLRMDKYKVLSAPTLEDAQKEFKKVIDGAMSVARKL